MDRTKPAIVRATALELLIPYAGEMTRAALTKGASDEDPLVRIGAARASQVLDDHERYVVARHLLKDPIRAVRFEAAKVFASLPGTMFGRDDRPVLEHAIAEYEQSLNFNADRPSSLLGLANLYTSRNQLDKAQEVLLQMIGRYPRSVYAYVNLADLYRVLNRDTEGEVLLRKAIAIDPHASSLWYALGLLLTREQKMKQALEALKDAVQADPRNASYAYTYAIALNSMGQSRGAVRVLEGALRQHPVHKDLLLALVTINRDRRALEDARRYARRLVELAPDEPTYRQLLMSLQGGP
jgi:tetratricopeptide (TPR) repeat protein